MTTVRHHYTDCNVITWPWVTRHLDPSWLCDEVKTSVKWRIPQWWRFHGRDKALDLIHPARMIVDRRYKADQEHLFAQQQRLLGDNP